jgi:uncharacterized membrane protein YczE
VRLLVLVLGLAVFAVGIVFLLESDLGLSPWDVLHQGVADQTPLSFGTAHVVVSLAVLAVAAALGAQLGLGTVANAVLVGLFVLLLTKLDAVDGLSEHGLAFRVVLLILGLALIGMATALYLGAAFGAGPRDSLMVIGSARTRFRIGLVRAALETSALAVGWALGGTVGVGTVAFVLLIGPSIEGSFWLVERLAPTVRP